MNTLWMQHGCGKKENDPHWVDCQMILQYMCQDESVSTLKNGMQTTKPGWSEPKQNESYQKKKDRKRKSRVATAGRHETFEYYDSCFTRDRNGGLFTADQGRNPKGGATRTRQNSGGGRSGLECPEERDYYPYWHPNPWTDIAVLTSQDHNCEIYKQESFNRKPKHECVEYYEGGNSRRKPSTANNAADCATLGGTWVMFYNYLEIIPDISSKADCQREASKIRKSFGSEIRWEVPYLDGEGRHNVPERKCLITPPDVQCQPAPWVRANHLGNTENGNLPSYKWRLPHFRQS